MFRNIFKFVMPFFFLMLVTFSQNSFAQLSGTYTVPGTPFATVKAAFDSLNLVGVGGGGVTINVTADYTESVSDSVLILTATGTVSNPVVFQKSGVGANPLITRTDAGWKTPTTLGAQGDAVIIIQGSDYVTFDGIDVAASDQGIEYGYYLRKVSGTDGCKYVTIKNSVIDMTKGTSAFVAGIYSSNNTSGSSLTSATGITVTSTGGRNEFVTITGNTIQDVFSAIVLRGYNHTTAPYDYYDQNFVVGQNGAGNILQNFAGNAAQSAYGVYAIYHNNLDVSYNTINNTANGGSNFTSTGYGIFHSTSSAATGTFNNNVINLSATTGQLRAITAGASGIGVITANSNTITLSQAGTSEASGIYVQSLSAGSTVTMNYNTVSYGTFASTSQSVMFAQFGQAISFSFVGNQNNGVVNKTGSGNLYCLNATGGTTNGVEIITDNTFDSITVAGSSTLYGIHVSTNSAATREAYNNVISNLTGGTGTTYGLSFQTCLSQQVHDNTVRDITGGGTTYGLYFAGNNPSVYNNTVSNISTSGASLVGIYDAGSQTTNCYKNQVFNLTSSYSGASTMTVCGIQITSGTVGNYVYNNFISDVKVPNATVSTNALFGINASASGATNKIRLYYNTIYLNSTSSGTSYKSYAIFSNSGHNAELRNNIAVNTSNGNAVAYGRSTSNFGTYSDASDNNDFYAANIFHDGTTYYTTLADYQNLVYPKDQATFSENPPFVNTTTTPYDLHINTGVATQNERGGRPVLTPIAITEDFDGVTRDASFTDVGADEFSGIVLDLTAPIIAYIPFDNTSSLADRALVVNISDEAGVPLTAPGWPNLYWKKGIGGIYTSVQPASVTGNDYTFNFGSGVVPTDTVFYYVVAQDGAGTPNVRAFPTIGAGGYTINPPAAGTPPTSPSSYQVTSSSLFGDYTVGTALFNQVTGRNIRFEKSGEKWIPMENGQPFYGDLYAKKIEHPEFDYPDGTDGIYATLTAAIADLNLRGVSGAVNFLLTDASYTTLSGETFPYVVNITNEFKPTSTNAVTIKPNTGVTSSIHGASPNSFIFRILSNYVNINGSNSGGTDRSLTIQNDTTYFPMVVNFASTGTTPITGGSLRNCIITNGSNTVTSFTPAVLLSNINVDPANFTFTSGYFTNLAIENNRVQKSDIGIYALGVASAGNGNGLSIDSNSLNDTTANSIGNTGIQISGADGATITNNNIGNIITPVSGGSLPTGIAIASQTINSTISNNSIGPINIASSSSGPVGISINTGNANSNLIISNNTITGLKLNQPALVQGITIGGLSGNILITKNRIYDLKNTYVSTSAYGAYAMSLGSNLTAANITVANNFIWDVAAYGRNSLSFHNGYGVYISAGGGYNLYHNTISLSTDQTLDTGLPACINISSSITTASSLDIRNNILANFETVGTDRYAIICNAANTVFANIDNNDYYTTGPNLGYLGSNRADLAAWQNATGKDVNSISADPKLVSATDLHADTNFDIVDGKGFYLATVPQDIDGDTRNNPPDIGADEYTYIPPPPAESYTFNGGVFSYGTINLTTGAFTSLNWNPQGSSYYPATADNDTLNSQYAIMSSFNPPVTYYLMHINFTTLTSDSIATVGPLASGQTTIKGMAYNVMNDTWYVISGDDFGNAAYLYTLNIATGALTTVGQIQNANLPTSIAIDCNGNAYIVNVVFGISGTAILNSLNLTTAVATAIGTDLGLSQAVGYGQDMDFNPDNGNLYWSGVWSSGFFGGGVSFRLVDVTTGTSTEIAAFGEFESLTAFNVNGYCPPPVTFQLSVDVTDGWNMVSIPGLNTPDQSVNTWWPDRDLGANVFKYLGGYQSITDAVPGIGYWMKNSGASTYNTGDEWPASGIQIVTHDPIVGASGWNLIGGYEISATASLVTTVPLGLQSGPIYKYSGGYQTATTIDPGYGYWIKLTGAGQIIIPEAFAKGEEPKEWFPQDWGRIVITDATGISYTLYTVNGEVNLDNYELPPAPLADMFDIRFSSGRIAEDINSSIKTINLSGVTYPLTVKVEGIDMKLMDESGKNVNVNLRKGEDVTISDATINKLMVSGGESLPTVYALEQNYPNPFNPSTIIEFSIPEDVSSVKLTIYNALGERVTELVNTSLKAGKYSYQWNAKNVATGMYIYELRTDKFVSVKKMLLLK